MAQKKTRKKTQKKTNNQQTSSKRKTKAQLQEEKAQMELAQKRKREIIAISLLVSGLLLFLLAVIKGESGWTVLHNAFFGLFGFCAFVLPILLIYLSVIISMEKLNKSFIPKSIEVSLFLLFLSSCIFIFKVYDGSGFEAYLNAFKSSFTEPDALGGGFIGAFFGFPIGALLGPTGAKILLIIATLTDLMIITGTTVSKLTGSAKTVHRKAKEEVREIKQRREEIRRQVEKEPEEDYDDDDLIYDEKHVYRSRKTPDLEIEDPEPDVLTGEKTKRAKSRKSKNTRAEGTPSQADDDSWSTQDEADVSDDDLDAKMRAIMEAENRRKQQQELERKEGELKKEETISELEQAIEKKATVTSKYRLPPLNLLTKVKAVNGYDQEREMEENGRVLLDSLASFGVEATLEGITRGPTVTRYDIKPAFGVRINRITNLSADLALALATTSIRIAPIPNKSAIGIEVPNSTKNTVGIRSLLESEEFHKMRSKKLAVVLGENIAGEPQLADLSKMPHLLIAGTTGSGKSVCLNCMIMSILYNATPDEVQFIMIDPKGVELSVYNGIPHMPTPVVKNANKAAGALAWAVKEMLNRYALLEQYKVRDIYSYNKLAKENPEMKMMTQYVIIIDELADLMMVAPNEVEDSICRLAQMARAAGMHLVIATQSPRADVITGLIKSNIPSRIALSVANSLESRIIIDQNGAETLLGHGDMLFNPIGVSKPTRIQGCFVSDIEIEKVTEFIKNQGTGI